MSDFWYWSKGRVISLVIASIYLVLGLIFWHDTRLIGAIFILILALTFIWFGNELGGFEGVTSKGYIRKTPGMFMRLGGWFLLVLPVILGIIYAISHKE